MNGDISSAYDYNWIMLELHDQTAREKSGGDILAYLRQDSLPNEYFVYAQIGEEVHHLVETLRKQSIPNQSVGAKSAKPTFPKLNTRMRRMKEIKKTSFAGMGT
jgi:hypothetical protein